MCVLPVAERSLNVEAWLVGRLGGAVQRGPASWPEVGAVRRARNPARRGDIIATPGTEASISYCLCFNLRLQQLHMMLLRL